MKTRVLEFLHKIFPNLPRRAVGLTILSCLCLVIYTYHGNRFKCPPWFYEYGYEWTGIAVERFHQYAYSHLFAFVTFLIVPLIVSRFLGMTAKDLGLTITRHAKKEFLLVLVLWAAFLPVVWFMSGTEAFQRQYPKVHRAETDAFLFMVYEGFYLVKWTAWEFFFRGFMLFGFKKEFGTKAVLISTIPFVLMHFGKPEAEVFAAIAAGFILCGIALSSRSIWPGVLLHWLVATSMDFFASSWWR